MWFLRVMTYCCTDRHAAILRNSNTWSGQARPSIRRKGSHSFLLHARWQHTKSVCVHVGYNPGANTCVAVVGSKYVCRRRHQSRESKDVTHESAFDMGRKSILSTRVDRAFTARGDSILMSSSVGNGMLAIVVAPTLFWQYLDSVITRDVTIPRGHIVLFVQLVACLLSFHSPEVKEQQTRNQLRV